MYLLSCLSKPQSFTSTRSNSIPVKCTPRNKVYQKSFFQFSNSFALWLFQSTAGAHSATRASHFSGSLVCTQVIFFARALLGSHTFIDLNFSFRVENGIEAKQFASYVFRVFAVSKYKKGFPKSIHQNENLIRLLSVLQIVFND